MNRIFCKLLTVASLSCGAFMLMPLASADVIGSLQLNGGSVTVFSDHLVWSGFATVGAADTITYDGGTPLALFSNVTLQNLPPVSLPLNNFMTFAAAPDMFFNLTAILPGSSNTNCGAPPCSVFAGSPIVLTAGSGGTIVDLGLAGTAVDGTGHISNWIGEFSETITSLTGSTGVITPQEIANFFLANPSTASITSTYSGTFFATITPEPSSWMMFLLGGCLIAVALARRPKQVR